MIAGGPAIPAALLSELRRLGVAVRPVPTAERLGAEPGYRPSTALQRFVRNRDLTCCFPGCHHPAEYCDLDHTLAYATSRLTHPGNLKCLCRKHHLFFRFRRSSSVRVLHANAESSSTIRTRRSVKIWKGLDVTDTLTGLQVTDTAGG